jgi:hypothetical protein
MRPVGLKALAVALWCKELCERQSHQALNMERVVTQLFEQEHLENF